MKKSLSESDMNLEKEKANRFHIISNTFLNKFLGMDKEKGHKCELKREFKRPKCFN